MKKLQIEELAVESFVTSREVAVRGTVAAHQDDTNSVYTACNTCGTACTDVTCYASCDGDTGGTRNGITCNVTCLNGVTDCGTCAPAASCDLQYGCGGTSFDMQPC